MKKLSIIVVLMFACLSFNEEKKISVEGTRQQWQGCVTTLNAAIYIIQISKQDKFSNEEINAMISGLSALRNEISIKLKLPDSTIKKTKEDSIKAKSKN